ncbi:conserved hypothetical protein [Thermoanaerobacter mathranii subsp. mathranii str. A3]|uniref:DUF1648 domain-containing protein n=3 Tax=Thermoanaerobacter TaxID=1754 RepID=D3T6S6_THEIA|nr:MULTISPECIES: DUF1648 domain-containing protein [Thermoanaerobacter]ADD01689.1 conserved hypothetical protein [Thermoanaerobacter italicus Ab9]ADH60217.1 conserved hypothetical protein [Thermoanaerobacter mathranii subsp. mathranii str. A3]MBT1278397.1 DUF1648 domain-containing protein [Thermoanaerobacter sp. CM-CNRG TB177]MDP9749833.1 heme/copper-type cytochrome/quinol oxidase subunit 2 [Thermoanaerobacter pentosaceus]
MHLKKIFYNYLFKFGWLLPILTLAINISVYKYLPDNIALQKDAFGNINYWINKLEFIFFIPVLQLFAYIAVKYPQAKRKKQIFHGVFDIGGGIILLFLDIFLIYLFIKQSSV